MIVTSLTGGLGNQMFQYAAGLALAERHRTVQKLDVTWFGENTHYEAHNRYGLSCFNVNEQFATKSEIDAVRGIQLTRTERWSIAFARVLRLRRYVSDLASASHWHRPPRFSFYPEFFDLPGHAYLNGMFQSEKFFAPVARLLRLHFSFRFPVPPEVAALSARIASGPSVALHFRRGDYNRDLGFKAELGVIGVGYYHRAVELLRQRSPGATLYIFSDDIDSVAQEFRPPGPHEFVRCIQPWHAHDALRLMGLCDHLAVANSTFSWWAAWLNPSVDKLVIAPDPWFANSSHDTSDVVPTSWRRLPTKEFI